MKCVFLTFLRRTTIYQASSTYEHDVIIEGGEIRKRKKKPSKRFRDDSGHTPLSIEEKIP